MEVVIWGVFGAMLVAALANATAGDWRYPGAVLALIGLICLAGEVFSAI
jgi:hypothetical protein